MAKENYFYCHECGSDYLLRRAQYINSDTDIDFIWECQDCMCCWMENISLENGRIKISWERFFFG